MKHIIILGMFLSFHCYSLTGLKVGTKAPVVQLKNSQGKIFDSSKINKKIIYVFYRGSWCPYCISQLKDLNLKLLPDLQNGKSLLVGISVDKIQKAKKMKKKFNLNFDILSDTKAKTLKAFNIVNKLSDETVKKYKTAYKIDVEGDSGETHHMVAHPGVFIVDENGKIIFSDVHLNYKQRTKIKDIKKHI